MSVMKRMTAEEWPPKHNFVRSDGVSCCVLKDWCVVCGGHPTDPIHRVRKKHPSSAQRLPLAPTLTNEHV